jgi:hypothetical protein
VGHFAAVVALLVLVQNYSERAISGEEEYFGKMGSVLAINHVLREPGEFLLKFIREPSDDDRGAPDHRVERLERLLLAEPRDPVR